MMMATVKKGKPDLRKKVLPACYCKTAPSHGAERMESSFTLKDLLLLGQLEKSVLICGLGLQVQRMLLFEGSNSFFGLSVFLVISQKR
ncbi:Ribosomal protein L14p/L23e family protein [Quillaja saponaria]|uniref:Ribosomal protein L14p/L23e family protein n=1 Tax=Quillaja saponaria TaxID=32244 RepID=A0AAD7PH39_QUISA|nr:Ribosomal protein L14p/L23e family protein [Quillaja saponaria]KAJ7954660.1 Ribosomal protein L14p/L23e family protein [Quillaja saponaria]